MVENNKPSKVYKAGVLNLSLWENVSESGDVMKSYTIQRAYKDKEDKWQHTSTLRSVDLTKLKILLEEAYRDLVLN